MFYKCAAAYQKGLPRMLLARQTDAGLIQKFVLKTTAVGPRFGKSLRDIVDDRRTEKKVDIP